MFQLRPLPTKPRNTHSKCVTRLQLVNMSVTYIQENFLCIMRRSNLNLNIPPGKPRASQLFKIGSLQIPAPLGQNGVQMPYLIVAFCLSNALLKNNRRRFLSSVIKLVFIRGTQRHQFKRESYFKRWLRGTPYALRTRNTY